MLCVVTLLLAFTSWRIVGSSAEDTSTENQFEELATEAAEGFNNFAVDFLKKVSTKNQNVFFSPYSIASVLGLSSLAVQENRLKELNALLHLDKLETRVPRVMNKVFKHFSELYGTHNPDYTLLGSCKIFTPSKSGFEDEVKENALNYYNATFEKLGSADDINKWVAEVTENHIKKIVENSDMKSILMVMVSVLYFKGAWEVPFSPKKTKARAFYNLAGKKLNVPTMFMKSSFGFGADHDLGVKVLEMFYEGKDISMVLVLPLDKKGLPKLIKQLTIKSLNRVFHNTSDVAQTLEVKLPKFKLELSYDLKETLTDMGLNTYFLPATDGKFSVDRFVHKSVIEVDEKGTKAAAASTVIMERSMPPEFNANRPFLFFIIDRRSTLILFAGAMFDPTAAAAS